MRLSEKLQEHRKKYNSGEYEREKNPFIKSMIFAVSLYALSAVFAAWLLLR